MSNGGCTKPSLKFVALRIASDSSAVKIVIDALERTCLPFR